MLCHKLLLIVSLEYIIKRENLLKASHLWDSVLGNEGMVCLACRTALILPVNILKNRRLKAKSKILEE